MASRISYVFCALVMVYASLVFYPKWQQDRTEATISWDASGYYWYLPSVFIYRDLKHQGFHDSILKKYNPTVYPDFQQAFRHQDAGGYVIKYPAGMAVMEAPFFAAGHLAAKASGAPADGFSRPYQFSLQLGGLLAALLGLWIFRRFLLLYYADATVAVVLAILVLTTNYLNYAAIDVGMSHAWLFTLYAMLLLATHRFYEQPSYHRAAPVGLLVGLATLTRPTEAISCMIPLLWGLESLSPKVLVGRWRFFIAHWRKVLLAAGCAAAVVFIQPLYWHWATGEWIVYSYQDQGFSFLHPHFRKYTLSAGTGWLLYTPVMAFAFLGLLPFLRSGKNKVAVTAFTLIAYYIVASWDVWQFGGRAMVQSYAVMMIPMAALVDWLRRQTAWLRGLALLALGVFIYYNAWYTIQAHPGYWWPGKKIERQSLLETESNNRQYFLRTAGRWRVSEDVLKLRETEEIFEGRISGKQLLRDTQYAAPGLALAAGMVKETGTGTSVRTTSNPWLRGNVTAFFPGKEWNLWNMPQLLVTLWQGNRPVRQSLMRMGRYIEAGERKTMYLDIRTKDTGADSVSLKVWNEMSPVPVNVERLWIEALETPE